MEKRTREGNREKSRERKEAYKSGKEVVLKCEYEEGGVDGSAEERRNEKWRKRMKGRNVSCTYGTSGVFTEGRMEARLLTVYDLTRVSSGSFS